MPAHRTIPFALLAILMLMAMGHAALAAVGHEPVGPPPPDGAVQPSLRSIGIEWPSTAQIWRVLSLRDHATRVVVIGTTLLGLSAGVVGTFMLLRKRSLTADALSHATLPGIGLAFILAEVAGGVGKSLPVLLTGALVFGLLGMACISLIRHTTRLKDDAALGIVLSVFFGLGVAVLGIIQKMSGGSAAGLQSFIYGKTASMLTSDAMLIGLVGAAVVLLALALFKEFTLLCFDEGFAGSQGWPTLWIDLTMMAMVVAVTVVGLQAVGLILLIAMLIIPSAAGRFWTDNLKHLLWISALIGGLSGWLGTTFSALVPRLPAGAIIVVVAACLFAFSMFFGRARGIIIRSLRHAGLTQRITHQHLMRAFYEILETQQHSASPDLTQPVAFKAMLNERSWNIRTLHRLLRKACREGLVREGHRHAYHLTERGRLEAQRIVRNHRLWEMYLMAYADVAPSHVDRDADMVEHVLAPEVVVRLENRLREKYPQLVMPASPHDLARSGGNA